MQTTTLTCPKCRSEMSSYERSGIIIDQCTGCRGLFLDRGELERLIDLDAGSATASPTGGPTAEPQWTGAAPDRSWRPADHPPQHVPYGGGRHWDDDSDSDHRRSRGGYGHGHQPRKKRHSLLKDLLDF